MANHKDQQQSKRERLSGDDLEVPVQLRERPVRKAADFRVGADSPEQHGSVKARVSVPPLPLVPPEPHSTASTGKPKGAAQAKYAGTVIGEALQRRETGRLGQPQPLAQTHTRPAPVVPKSSVSKPGAVTGSEAPVQNKRQQEAQPPVARATERPQPERLRQIFPNALAEQQRLIAVEESRPFQPSRRMAAAPLEEWLPYPVPVVGPHQAMILCIVLCVVLVWGLFYTPLGKPIGFYSGPLTLSEWVNQTIGLAPASPQSAKPVKTLGISRMQPMSAPIGETSIVQPPSMTAEQIDAVLSSYGSPAAGSGQDFYNLGVEYGIDPAYAVAFFIHESSAGTNAGWAGIKPDGSTTHNIGNIICAGYPTCYNRFRDYASWSEGIDDWYKLIATEYINGRGAYTVEQIIPVYAPSFENNVPGYIQAVNALVDGWRQGSR